MRNELSGACLSNRQWSAFQDELARRECARTHNHRIDAIKRICEERG